MDPNEQEGKPIIYLEIIHSPKEDVDYSKMS
jgi:hypothetical protein